MSIMDEVLHRNAKPTETAQVIDAYYRWIANTKIDIKAGGGFVVDKADLHPSLFPHQVDTVQWMLARGKAMNASSFGLGKTRIACECMRQIHLRTGGKTLIVAPLGVRHQFVVKDGPAMGMRIQYVRTDAEALAADTPYLITNYERVREGDISAQYLRDNIEAISLDEGCFVAGTLVDTPNGQRSIEVLKPGDSVYSAVGIDTVCAIETRIANKLVKLRIDNGMSIISSDNHPYLTTSGWRRADQLSEGDELVTTTEAVRILREGIRDNGQAPSVLFEVLRREMAHGATGSEEKSEGDATQACRVSHLRMVRQAIRGALESANAQPVLLPVVFGGLAYDAAGNTGEIVFSRSYRTPWEKQSCVVCKRITTGRDRQRAHQVIKSDQGRNGASEDFCNHAIEGNKANAARWQWKRSNLAAANTLGTSGRRMVYGVSDFLGRSDGWISDVLQGGYRESGFDDCNRSGWTQPSDAIPQNGRHETGCEVGRVRVESVEILEPGDPEFCAISGGKDTVTLYDLQVTRHPSFSVGGVLVHNSVIRSLGSDTHEVFEDVCRPIPYRFVCTATPSPNDFKELIYYAQFLGVMDAGQALTRWFKRDSQKAGHLTIHPHLEREFWMWVASWALFVQKPSDLGYADTGYTMPEIDVTWHRIAADHEKAWEQADKYGNVMLFKDSASSIQAATKEKRDSLQDRVLSMVEIVLADAEAHPEEQWVIWCHLNDEQRAIEHVLRKHDISFSSIYGSLNVDETERRLYQWLDRETTVLISKPTMLGVGVNLQQSHKVVFVGLDYKFHDFIQAVHRVQRFGQTSQVEVHILHTDAEDHVVEVMKTKWTQHNHLVSNMTDIIREFGMTNEALSMNLKRTLGLSRQEASGKWFTAINNDSIVELQTWADNSVDLIHTSIPFSKHYEYSPSKNDMGHNPSNDAFWQQMDFLIPELYRVTKPGRMAVIHVKDLLEYAHNSGLGVMAVYPFSDDCVAAFRKHGFIYCGRITVNTDVVRENNSTYRLSWSEMVKDGTKMSAGLPEYVLLFRKKQSDTSRSYADEPVVHTKEGYPVSRWQVDAHAYWRSSGNRLLRPDEIEAAQQQWTPEQLTQTDPGRIYRWYKLFSSKNLYSYEDHLAMVAALDEAEALPKTYGLMLPHAPDGGRDYVWSDVVAMETLNSAQFRRGEENHVCPLPFDIVERIIERFSNPDELVLDPFGGLFTVPYIAVKMKRRGVGIELNPVYYEAGLQYCKEAEMSRSAPTLFELIDLEAQAMAPEMKMAA